MANKFRFITPPPVPDLQWGVYVEERLGITPVSIRLYSYDDPAEAWAQLLTQLERLTRNRIFYVKERGKSQRWTDYRKTIRHLFSYKRSRYYLNYKDFLRYASGKSQDDYKAPPPDEGREEPDEVDEELLKIPDVAVDWGDEPPPDKNKYANMPTRLEYNPNVAGVPPQPFPRPAPTLSHADLSDTRWKERQKKRRL